jgi:hypothetical protein
MTSKIIQFRKHKMLNLKKSLVTDERKENDGIWYELGQDASVKVARAGNDIFKAEREKFRKANAIRIQYRSFSPAEELEADIDLEAKAIFLDFKNISLEEGVALENSLENRKKLLREKNFRAIVKEVSYDIENYLVVAEGKLKEDLGKH